MTVTKLKAVTKTKYKVFLDGDPAFVLYTGELSKYGISEGKELSEPVYHIIMKEVRKSAKLKAMRLLEAMDRTEKGLREKLEQDGYPKDAVERALDYVKSYGYINDSRYAENFIDSRKNSKSRRQIYALLREKGIEEETLEHAFSKCYENEDETLAIKKLIHKKGIDTTKASKEELGKLYGYLARKGFTYEDIRRAIQLL